jgi:two-component system nitrogen regulation response regulator NtrX
MFGHERGAFTGATQARVGRFELAHLGTLFLDEIGDLSLDAQAKLLRAIEAKEIHRVGGNRSIRVDVRIIAATNHDLARAVRDGSFREDLFFRLNVIPIALPPLRERDGDVPELVRHFSLLHFRRTGQIPPTWTPGAVEVVETYPWPGNVRELANIVERIAIMRPGIDISAADIRAILHPDEGNSFPAGSPDDAPVPAGGLGELLDAYERRTIRRALSDAAGNIAEAARRLQTDRPNLYRRMKRLGLDGVKDADRTTRTGA